MKSTKTFNNISPELMKQIPKLKPNEVVVFQMLNGVPNPEPDERERSKDPILYGKIQIQTNFRVYDKYQKDDNGEMVGGYVDVGCVDAWLGDNPVKFRTFVPGVSTGVMSRFQGKFQLMGGVQKDEELYEILYLSPQREGSPCKDEGVEVLFKILDLKADTKNSTTKFNTLKKVIDILDAITEDDARQVMRALNQPEYQDKEVLLAKVRDFGKSNVDQFLQVYESKDRGIKADIREALNSGVLSHDIATGEVKLGGIKIADFKTQSTSTFVDEFTRWIEVATNGKDVHENLKAQNKSKKVAK